MDSGRQDVVASADKRDFVLRSDAERVNRTRQWQRCQGVTVGVKHGDLAARSTIVVEQPAPGMGGQDARGDLMLRGGHDDIPI